MLLRALGFTFSYLPNVAIYFSTVRKSVWSGQIVCWHWLLYYQFSIVWYFRFFIWHLGSKTRDFPAWRKILAPPYSKGGKKNHWHCNNILLISFLWTIINICVYLIAGYNRIMYKYLSNKLTWTTCNKQHYVIFCKKKQKREENCKSVWQCGWEGDLLTINNNVDLSKTFVTDHCLSVWDEICSLKFD